MKYENQNFGLINFTDPKIEDGMIVKIISEAYSKSKESFDGEEPKVFWNVKVQLRDGTKRLASIQGISGDRLAKEWGTETKAWIGKFAKIISSGKSPFSYSIQIANEPAGWPQEEEINTEDVPF